MNPNPQLVTAQELAEALDLTPASIAKYTRENKLPPAQERDGEYLYDLDAIIQVLTGIRRD